MSQKFRVSRFVSSMLFFTIASLAGALMVGCNKDGEGKGEAEVEETGVDIQNSPFSAIGKLAEVGKQMQEKQEQMANRKPVDPLPFGELIPLLPQVDGWTSSDEAKGETTQMGEYKITTVSQSYSRTTGEKTENMSVTILDGGYVPMVYAPFLMMSQFSREGTDGHSKGLTISGQPAFEEWKKAQESVNLSILVEDRFLITLNGDSVSAEEGRAWAGHIKLNQLKDLAKKAEK